MDLMNKDVLKSFIDILIKKYPAYDPEALKSIQKLTDAEVMLLLYNDMAEINKFKKGTYNGAAKVMGSVIKSSPYEKLITAYLEYLDKKSNESETIEKIPYLKSILVFINWLNDEVYVKPE